MADQPSPGTGAGTEPARDSRLAGFAKGGGADASPPGPELAALAAELSGPQWRCTGATDDELTGLLGRWAALESWAAAAKLGVVREMIRRGDQPWLSRQRHGDLPDTWDETLEHELAAALGMSAQAADKLIWLAWELEARLPGIGAKLTDGTITYVKARAIADELAVLGDDHAAQAAALIVDKLAGKTPGQIMKLAAQAACTVDPEGAAKRRKLAEKEDARVRFWREHTGAAALAAYGLPTDEALAAHANVNARAEEYKKSKAFPDARMDQLRVLGYLDLLNGVSAAARVARARAMTAAADAAPAPGRPPGADDRGEDDLSGEGPGENSRDDGPGSGEPGGGPGPDCQPGGPALPALAARTNLTIPLATLLNLANRPGEGHGLGPLDPALARDLAATAAGSPGSQWCVTVVDADGIALGHGCARPAGKSRRGPSSPWAFTRREGPGPPDGYGTWTLTLPGGKELTVQLGPVPVHSCDHRHESHAYQANDTLRHLVQVRDGECTFPPCSRHARDSDFEHAIPYDKGGRTCACNGGARSRKCHRVKQSPGWKVTQPRPGWHQWTTPSGRTYMQGPKQYPS